MNPASKMKNKRGTILAETVLDIALNLIFLTLLVVFVLRQGGGAIVLEQSYAKQIALIIDSAKPGMIIKLNTEKIETIAKKNGIGIKDIVKIKDNIVTIKISQGSGYSYSFFNDVDVSVYPDIDNINYIIKINSYKNE